MQILKSFKQGIACATLMAAGLMNVNAQTTAIWKGPNSGGEWNTGANWTTGFAPLDSTTNAFIGTGTNVNYSLPMTAASFGILTNSGTLNISASGFNCSALLENLSGGGEKLFINSGGAVAVSGLMAITTNGQVTLGSGASLSVSNLIVPYNSGNADLHAYFTNNGGTYTALKTTLNNSGNSTLAPHFVINGGLNNLGITTLNRSHATTPQTLGSDGLAIFGGTVIMTNLTLAGASVNQVYIQAGTVTNYGNVSIASTTAPRYMRVAQSGGLFVVADPNIIYLNTVTAGTETARYQVTGGTNFIGGMYLGASNSAAAATVTVTVGGTVYVGSQGIATNGAVINTFTLSSGGVFGATADWLDSVNMNLSGANSAFTFQAADPANTSHNITVDGILSGGGPAAFINKTGGGTLTLDAANTYTGTTLIKAGTLVLGANASLASTPVLVGSGAFYDVSAVSGGYTLTANQALAGLGTVSGAVASLGTINPGSNTINGTLTFSSSITETGGATNHFDLIGTPGAGNDKVIIAGDFNASGLNYIDITGGANGNVYPLIQYGGNFNGDASVNLAVTGSPGILSNNVATKTIYLISQNTARSPTNIVWVGNAVNNAWDVNASTNWVLNGSLNHFMTGDNVLFDNTGAINPNVTLDTSVSPASTTVSSSSTYTLTGAGSIDGSGGSLTKDGSGTLSLQTVNTYTGPTTIKGGVLEVSLLANGGVNSAIGASVSDPSTLIVTNSTLRYTGGTVVSDRAATLGGTATFDVTNNATTLTLSGGLFGSGTLTKNGNGVLMIAGSGSSYSGGIILNAGTLALKNADNALGSSNIVLNGGTLSVGTNKPANNIIVTNGVSVVTGTSSSSGVGGIRNIIGSSNLVVAVTSGGGVFDLFGDVSTYSGTLTFSNAGGVTVRLNGSAANVGSALATWDLGVGPMDLNVRVSSTSNNIGALRGGSSTTLSGRGGSGNSGSTTYYIGALNLSTLFDGVIQNGIGTSSPPVPSSSSPTSINKIGSGTLSLSGTSTTTGTITISSGTLALVNNPVTSNDGSINNATINIVSGAFLDVSARSDSTLQLGSSATQLLEGRGTLNGSLNTGGSGTVSPGGGLGGSVGTLKVTNSITLGGTAWMKLNRGASTNSDRLVSSLSSITYGGTLVVTNVGAQLHVADTFTLFSGSGLGTATFGTVVLPNYYTWDTSQLGINGSVTVTGVLPPPSMTNVDFSNLSNGSITLNAVNGATNGLVIVQTTTDLASPWTSISTNSFDGNGNFSQSVTVDPAAPQSFFRLLGL